MQPHYNLLYHEKEREMLSLCVDQGITVMPWSPLAGGKLTREPNQSDIIERAETDEISKRLIPTK